MNRNIIWVTGPSASGKTLIVNNLLQRFPDAKILSDGREMLKLNKLDINHEHHVHPGGGEGFFLTTSYHFNESVRRIVDELYNFDSQKMAIVEIARGQGSKRDIDLSYERFLQLVPNDIFDRSVILYSLSSWETRYSRNMGRRTTSYSKNVERESFHVPNDAMESFFRTDDFEMVKDRFPCPVHIINNENISKSNLEQQVSYFVQSEYK